MGLEVIVSCPQVNGHNYITLNQMEMRLKGK